MGCQKGDATLREAALTNSPGPASPASSWIEDWNCFIFLGLFRPIVTDSHNQNGIILRQALACLSRYVKVELSQLNPSASLVKHCISIGYSVWGLAQRRKNNQFLHQQLLKQVANEVSSAWSCDCSCDVVTEIFFRWCVQAGFFVGEGKN